MQHPREHIYETGEIHDVLHKLFELKDVVECLQAEHEEIVNSDFSSLDNFYMEERLMHDKLDTILNLIARMQNLRKNMFPQEPITSGKQPEKSLPKAKRGRPKKAVMHSPPLPKVVRVGWFKPVYSTPDWKKKQAEEEDIDSTPLSPGWKELENWETERRDADVPPGPSKQGGAIAAVVKGDSCTVIGRDGQYSTQTGCMKDMDKTTYYGGYFQEGHLESDPQGSASHSLRTYKKGHFVINQDGTIVVDGVPKNMIAKGYIPREFYPVPVQFPLDVVDMRLGKFRKDDTYSRHERLFNWIDCYTRRQKLEQKEW